MNVSLGPCKIQFNGSELGETLKSENVTLKIATKTQEVKTDESEDIKDEIEVARDITFEATLLLTNSLMATLGIATNVDSLLKKGTLKISSLRNNVVIDLYNAILKIELNFNFKSDKVNSIKIKAKALKDNLNKDILIKFN